MPDHAVEIVLTRKVSAGELRHARQTSGAPLAVGPCDRRLLTVLAAKSMRRALARTWKCLDDLLPIDVLTSAYPNADGEILLSVPMDDSTRDAVVAGARQRGVPPEAFVRGALTNALAERAAREKAWLESSLDALLTRVSPETAVIAVARRMEREHRAAR